MNFPGLIKDARTALRETQEEFAKRFNSHANTVSRWESGDYQAPYTVLEFVLQQTNAPIYVVCSACMGSGKVRRK